MALRRNDFTTYPISKLMDFATKEIDDITESTPPEDASPGVKLGFWNYCLANAFT
jgi:hypothetical protein